MYGTSGGKPQHRLYYLQCQGADGYRWAQGTRCTNCPVRQDYLDQIIWMQIIALLENEKLIQSEIDRRRETAGKTDPCERRKEILRSEQARLRNQMERLITAYQDGLLTLEQLRERMPHLKQQSQAVNSELQVWRWMAKLDQFQVSEARRKSGWISSNKLRARAETLDVKERQQILRLLVKESWLALTLLPSAIRFRFLPTTHLHPTIPVLPPPDNPIILCVPGVSTPVLGKHRFRP